MDPRKIGVKDLLNPNACVIIPKYQRRFSWSVEHAHGLLRDIAEVATQPGQGDHWTGVIIYRELKEKALQCSLGQDDINHTCREVIDGQQRLTTLRIWLFALRDHAAYVGRPLNYEISPFFAQSPNDVQLKLIESGSDVFDNTDEISRIYTYFRYLLWLGQDSLLFSDAIDRPNKALKGSTQVDKWTKWMKKKYDPSKPDAARLAKENGVYHSAAVDCDALLRATVNHLSFIGLVITDEEPETVFSALNGNRTELSQFDFLRNYAFGNIDQVRRDKIFVESWQPAELKFDALTKRQGVSHDQLKNSFLYDYLISCGEGAQGPFNAVKSFRSFTRFVGSKRFKSVTECDGIEDWVNQRLGLEIALWSVVRENFFETNLPGGLKLNLTAATRRAIRRIRLASDGPPTPLVLWVLRRSTLPSADPRHFSPEETERAVVAIEGYLYKSLLARKSLTNLRAAVIGSMGRIDTTCKRSDDKSAADIFVAEVRGWAETNWGQLSQELQSTYLDSSSQNVYEILKSRATLGLLDAIEEQLSGAAGVTFFNHTWQHKDDPWWVEHIFPIKAEKWNGDLRSEGIDSVTMAVRLHALGNLTALPRGVNASVSNGRYDEKKAAISSNVDAASPKLQGWLSNDFWTPELIDARTNQILQSLKARWPD